MLYVKNLPTWERVLRVALGAALAAGALVLWPGLVGWVVAGACAGMALSGLLGFCPACALAGRRLPGGGK